MLAASALGSWHCAGMCGPIASLMNQKKGLTLYHLGRLISYSLSGALIGQFGKLFLQSQITEIRFTFSLIFFILLLAIGFSFFLNLDLKKMNPLQLRPLQKISQWAIHGALRQSPFFVGVFSIVLPCSWLWTFLALAASTQSPFLGAYTLFVFWLGGIPALNALPFITKRLIKGSTLQQKKIAGLVLIFASLYSLLSFFSS